MNSADSPVRLFCAICMSLPCSESFFSSVTGFFKVLGQLTETGVVSPEQFISEYIIVSWCFVEVAENQKIAMLTAIYLALMQRDLLSCVP